MNVKARNAVPALDRYRSHTGSYPDSLASLVDRPEDVAREQWLGPYIQNPGDLKDAWGTDLHYRYPGARNPASYDLWSAGPDRTSGTGDDIGNW